MRAWRPWTRPRHSGADRIFWPDNRSVAYLFSSASLDRSGGGGQLNITGAMFGNAFGMALDPATNKVYWANSNYTFEARALNAAGHGPAATKRFTIT